MIQKVNHSSDRIKIRLIDTRAVLMANESSSYMDRAYYVYFDYEISNQSPYTIDSIEMVSYFKDKNGRLITQISSRFGGYGKSSMNLTAKSSIIRETYIKETQLEKDSVFSEIYNNDLMDYEISTIVTKIQFSDGTIYRKQR